MNDETIMNALVETRKPNFIDHDAVFRAMTDEDYDSRLNGVSRASFCNVYLPWIQYCNSRLKEVFIYTFYHFALKNRCCLFHWSIFKTVTVTEFCSLY